jgi:hypothetical protein
MQIPVLLLRRALIASAILVVLLMFLNWRPSRQVRLHQEHLLEAVGKRDWKKVGGFFAPDFKDRWGQSREVALRRLPQAFQDFLACSVEGGERSLEWHDGSGIVQARIRILGSGGGLARFVMEQVNQLSEPFTLTWRKQSWKPWDWALVSVDQPQIEIPAGDLDEL